MLADAPGIDRQMHLRPTLALRAITAGPRAAFGRRAKPAAIDNRDHGLCLGKRPRTAGPLVVCHVST